MPTFRVTGPNGEVYRVDAPSGATEAQAIAYAQKQHADQGNTGPTFQPVRDMATPVVAAWKNLAAHQADDKRTTLAQTPSLNPLKLASGMVDSVRRSGRMLGDVLALPAAAITGAVDASVAKPLARVMTNNIAARPYAAPRLSMANGAPRLTPARPLDGREAVESLSGDISLALSAGRAVPRSLAPVVRPA